MFTSPHQYACKLAYKLIEKGAKPVWVPGVQIRSLCDYRHQQACLIAHQSQCGSYVAVLFTYSLFAV